MAIDDCSRLGYAEVLLDERGETVPAFLRCASAGSPAGDGFQGEFGRGQRLGQDSRCGKQAARGLRPQ